MRENQKYKVAVFFTILFMALISAPTIILSIDDSADVSSFYSINEEEENENLKIVFKNTVILSEDLSAPSKDSNHKEYTFKAYPKPHLNLIFPPPEFIS